MKSQLICKLKKQGGLKNGIYLYIQASRKKYLLNLEQYEYVTDKISPYMSTDEYGETLICNIYFDNNLYELINASISRPVYKEKLRLRSYGVPNLNSTVFLEIKKKYKGIVYKRRISMTLKEAYDYINTGVIPSTQKGNIPCEIDYMIKHYRLSPKTYIGYNRLALVCDNDPNLRITFDSNIVSRYENIELEKGFFGKPLLPESTVLMEIKIPGAIPLWLAHILSDEKIFPQSFSKYGRIHTQHLIEEAYKNV